ncbi:MAG: uroporphyrinogen decarboxylase family protein [Lentisphaeria bacterium]|nr:uroporphyrinogen decarboxylase family protein [Lentisphaeria bacterium]
MDSVLDTTTWKAPPFSTPDEVYNKVAGHIRIFGAGGGFVFRTGHNIQADTPPENILAMYQAAQDHGVHAAWPVNNLSGIQENDPMSITPIRSKWIGTMTDRERFNNQMNHQPVDRCFNMEFGYWQENFGLWQGFVENGIRNNEDADLFFSFDRMGHAAADWLLPPFEEEILEERQRTVIMRDPDGIICEVARDGHSTIPRFMRSSIETPDDWARVKKARFDPGHPDRKPDIAALKQRFPDDRDFPAAVSAGSMIGRIRDVLTLEGLAYAIHDCPLMIEDMVETSCILVEHYLDAVLPHVNFDYASGWEDICYKTGPLVSLPFFTDVVVPRYKRIGEKLRRHGIDLWYTDCDGDVRLLLPGFLDAGINCMFPHEVNACCHPGQLLDEYGPDLRIMGGIDKVEIAKGGDAIKGYLESVAPYVERGGYIPFCDHRCPPDVSWENYLYYLDLKEDMFGQLAEV